MRDVSIVDISDPNNIQELLTDVGDDRLREDEADVLKNNDDDDDDDDDDNDDDEEEELGLIPRLLFGTFSTLTILVPLVSTHIALDIIVHQQYAQDFDAVEIAARAATAALVLVFLITSIHPRRAAPLLRFAMFFAFLGLGVAMIRVSREDSYYAVMKRVPGIGTLLIFCAVELPVFESALALLFVAGYSLWHGNGKLF